MDAIKSAIRFTVHYVVVIVASLTVSSLIDCQTIASLLLSCLCVGIFAVAFGYMFINRDEMSILNMIIPIESIKNRIWKK